MNKLRLMDVTLNGKKTKRPIKAIRHKTDEAFAKPEPYLRKGEIAWETVEDEIIIIDGN